MCRNTQLTGEEPMVFRSIFLGKAIPPGFRRPSDDSPAMAAMATDKKHLPVPEILGNINGYHVGGIEWGYYWECHGMSNMEIWLTNYGFVEQDDGRICTS